MTGKNKSGFTLLEVVLGLALSAMVLVLLLSALRLGQNSQEKGWRQQELNQRVRILSDRLGWLIRGVYPYTAWDDAGEAVLYFKGSEDSLSFVTTSVDAFSEGPEDIAGLKLISISVEDGKLLIRESVYFLEDALDGSSGKEFVLDTGIADMSVEYLDPDEPEGWLSSWDGQEKETPPAAVRIALTLTHKGREVKAPPFVASVRTAFRTKSEPKDKSP